MFDGRNPFACVFNTDTNLQQRFLEQTRLARKQHVRCHISQQVKPGMQLSPAINILGLLTTVLAAAMLIPRVIYTQDQEASFCASALLPAFFGVSVWLATNRRETLDLGLRQPFC